MSRNFRYFMFLTCAVQVVFAIAFFLEAKFAVDLWPLPGTTQMSFRFIASIFAAAAASTLWCLITQEYGALAGIALDYIGIFLPVAIFSFQIRESVDGNGLTLFALVSAVVAAVGVAMLLWAVRIPPKDRQPMPRIVRLSFVVFVILLVIAGVALILKKPNIVPWRVSEDMSVMIGWFFLGAVAYFGYGLLRSDWSNAGGQMAGFLAYDVVLIVPFLQRLPDIPDELRASLIIYLIAVVYSGLLGTYYLFINPGTRLRQLPWN